MKKKITGTMILLVLLFAGISKCQGGDSTSVSGYKNEIPIWLKEKIKVMSLDEKHYAGAKVFAYEIDSDFVFWINNPWSSCMYCELYNPDGTRLSDESIGEFMKEKKESVLIWENYPAVPFDSLKKNIKTPTEYENEEGY